MIVYFSGTGNTRYCAKILGEFLKDKNIRELSAHELCNPSSATLECDDNRIIWAFPTYSWGMPPVLSRYISNVRLGKGIDKAEHIMLTTCGDDTGYIDSQWRKILKKRGITGGRAFSVVMPNTYVCMRGFDVDPPELAEKKILEARPEIKNIAQAILNGSPGYLKRGIFPRLKSALVYPWFVRFDMSPKPFRTTEACTSCGTCIRSCPMNNMTADKDGRPLWHDNCAFCLRCYHICPRHAVAYGNSTDGKGQSGLLIRK